MLQALTPSTYTGSRYRARPVRRCRVTMPKDADPDCVAVSMALGVGYRQAVILKALAYGVKVEPALLSALSRLGDVQQAVTRISAKTGLAILRGKNRDGGTVWMLLDIPSAEQVRGVIRKSWGLS